MRHLQIYNSSSDGQHLWILTDIHNKSILQRIRVNRILYNNKNNHYLLYISQYYSYLPKILYELMFKAVTFDCLFLLILFLHQVYSSKDCFGSPALVLSSLSGSPMTSSSLKVIAHYLFGNFIFNYTLHEALSVLSVFVNVIQTYHMYLLLISSFLIRISFVMPITDLKNHISVARNLFQSLNICFWLYNMLW